MYFMAYTPRLPPPALGVKNFRKVSAGGGSEIFILIGGGGILLGVVEEVYTFLILEPFVYFESKC